MSIAGKTCS